jgi:hypothetical protein
MDGRWTPGAVNNRKKHLFAEFSGRALVMMVKTADVWNGNNLIFLAK